MGMSNLKLARDRGFTLLEIAIVMFVSSIIVVAILNAYKIYTERQFLIESRDKQRIIDSAISSYQARSSISSGVLPCPADPTLPLSDANSGVAQCNLYNDFLAGTASIGDCSAGVGVGICLVAGFRDTNADTDTLPDPVLIGAVPYKTLGLTMTDIDGDGNPDIQTSGGVSDGVNVEMTLDPWGYKMTYAVTAYMTDPTKYNNTVGALHIRTELGTDITNPPGGAHFVIVAHGNNHAGAYTPDGRIAVPCTAGTAEQENCDGDAVFVRGLRTLVAGANYYDDTVTDRSFSISRLWDFVYGTPDIYNLNIGNVGVGTITPSEKLQVIGNVKGTEISQRLICDSGGANCWDPNNIASYKGSQCSAYYPPPAPNNVWVVTGIQGGRVLCTQIPVIKVNTTQTCPVGKYVVGFDAGGNIICE